MKEGIFRIAIEKGLLKIAIHNLRDWTKDVHRTIDDRPYGGGPGMVIMLEPVFDAVQELKKENSKVVAMTPKGKRLNQSFLTQLAKSDEHYIILCGHYEGFDQRIHDHLVDLEISIGDYVLSGGELPALVFVDGMIRLVPGVLGNSNSLEHESFNSDKYDFPQYTRPANFKGWKVPNVLLSGNHGEIEEWRKDRKLGVGNR